MLTKRAPRVLGFVAVSAILFGVGCHRSPPPPATSGNAGTRPVVPPAEARPHLPETAEIIRDMPAGYLDEDFVQRLDSDQAPIRDAAQSELEARGIFRDQASRVATEKALERLSEEGPSKPAREEILRRLLGAGPAAFIRLARELLTADVSEVPEQAEPMVCDSKSKVTLLAVNRSSLGFWGSKGWPDVSGSRESLTRKIRFADGPFRTRSLPRVPDSLGHDADLAEAIHDLAASCRVPPGGVFVAYVESRLPRQSCVASEAVLMSSDSLPKSWGWIGPDFLAIYGAPRPKSRDWCRYTLVCIAPSNDTRFEVREVRKEGRLGMLIVSRQQRSISTGPNAGTCWSVQWDDAGKLLRHQASDGNPKVGGDWAKGEERTVWVDGSTDPGATHAALGFEPQDGEQYVIQLDLRGSH